jgi:hypothetical protein
VDPHKALRDLGLDSLMAIDLHNAVVAGVNKALPQTALFDHPTLDALARYLLDDVLSLGAPAEEKSEPAPVLPPSSDDTLTLVQASGQLVEALRELEELV